MFYSQKSYPKIKLGTCSDSISQSGCFLTSLCNIVGRDPAEVNEIFKKRGVYSDGCLINSKRAAEVLDIDYLGSKTTDPRVMCIAETNHYKKVGFPQHFFLYEKGKRVDPLDLYPCWEPNDYHIVSYRLFVKKAVISTPELPEPKQNEVVPIPVKVNETQPEENPNISETPKQEDMTGYINSNGQTIEKDNEIVSINWEFIIEKIKELINLIFKIK